MHKYKSQCGKYIYHISVIDYLQDFSFKKKAEIKLKQVFQHADPEMLSAMPSDKYQERFYKFMKERVFSMP